LAGGIAMVLQAMLEADREAVRWAAWDFRANGGLGLPGVALNASAGAPSPTRPPRGRLRARTHSLSDLPTMDLAQRANDRERASQMLAPGEPRAGRSHVQPGLLPPDYASTSRGRVDA